MKLDLPSHISQVKFGRHTQSCFCMFGRTTPFSKQLFQLTEKDHSGVSPYFNFKNFFSNRLPKALHPKAFFCFCMILLFIFVRQFSTVDAWHKLLNLTLSPQCFLPYTKLSPTSFHLRGFAKDWSESLKIRYFGERNCLCKIH